MTNVLDRLPPGARVAMIRLRSLGDCVLTTPALALLKQARPDLQIAVVVEDRFAPVFAGNPDVDQILAPERRQPGPLSSAPGAQSARRRHQRAFDAGRGVGPARRIRRTFASSRCTTCAFRARRKFWAWIAKSTPPNIWRPPCSIWECRQPRSRARDCSPSRTPGPRPYAVLHPFASEPDKTWPRGKLSRRRETSG